VGFTLRQGAVPTGQDVTIGGATARASVLNRWPDGSVRFCVIGGTYSSTGGTPTTITVGGGSVSPGASLTASAVQTAMGANTAVFDCGAFGTATFSGLDFSAPFATHFANDLCAEFVYREQIGSDSHLVAWLHTRIWSTGEVEFLPVIENGYINVASPTSKSATYDFTLAGVSRFSASINLPARSRTPLLSGSILSHWLGTDPDVTPTHDKAYLQSTELVPTYRAVVPPTSATVTGLVSSYTPLQQGDWTYSADTMSSGGFAAPIGLLPNHEAVYLTTTATSAYGAVIRNGYSAGRYGVHYRDEATNRPLRFSQHANRSANASSLGSSQVPPTASGTASPQWDVAHSPSLGFLPYLLTGRFYFMEQVQFAACANYLSSTDLQRNFANGWFEPQPGAIQVRQCAWAFRTLVQALAATPDSDPANLRGEFIASVEANIDRYHSRYVAASNNPLGFIECDVDYAQEVGRGTDLFTFAPWQQDFHTAAWGMALAMNLPISSTASAKMAAFFAWKAQSIVGRLGTSVSPDYWYINAQAYEVAIAPSDAPNWTTGAGPWFTTWRQVYDATSTYMAAGGGRAFGTVEGILDDAVDSGVSGQWGNLQPALAYAVRHGVAGAQDAYDRLIQSANWPELVSAFNDLPVWGVMPARSNPTWLGNPAIYEVVNVPGGQTPGGSGTIAYCGLANRDTLMVLAATGGHGDSSDNGIRSINLRDNTPAWVQRRAPFATPVADVAYYQTTPTIEPSSRHSYNFHIWNAVRGKMLMHSTRFVWPNAQSFAASNALSLSAWDYDAVGTIPDGAAIVQDTSGRAYGLSGFFGITEYDPVANTRTFLRNFGSELTRPMAFDTKRKVFFQLSWGNGDGGGTGIRAFRYGARFAVSSQQAITFNAGAGLTALEADQVLDTTLVYVPALDRYFYWTGNNLYRLTPSSGTVWDIEVVALTGATIPGRPVGVSGVDSFARMAYVESLGGIAILHRDAAGVQFVRVH